MASRSNRGCMWTRLLGLVLLLTLPALACGIPAGRTPVSVVPSTTPEPGSPPEATATATATPEGTIEPPQATATSEAAAAKSLPVSLWNGTFSDANGWNKSPYWDTLRFPDVNGDGLADVCGRGIAGVYCGLSNGTSFPAVTLWEGTFTDANGWNTVPYWNTIRFPDVNGDGKADLCGRGIAGVYCGLSNGGGFSTVALWEGDFSDANGWNKSPYWNTIQFPDVNGDGKADLCGRGISGEYCGLSTGSSFSAVTLWESTFSDANGWNTSPYWNSLQFADVNGDGKADLCGRGVAGEYCETSNGTGFPAATQWEGTFSDANGWNKPPYWNSIGLADVNNDGKADICGRGIAGEYCGISNGAGFSAVALWESTFSDANGWNKSPYWDTLQLTDVNGDGSADLCARGIAGVYCGLSDVASFSAAAVWDSVFSDANGWNKSPYWNTIRFPDVNGDGQADLCGRGIDGIYCGASNGSGF